jgi:D-sedoheptulose 7-phosphate isomerase
VLICGNGGSAADAQHLATELLIRYRSGHERRSLPAISLAADSSTLTACSNDYGFDRVFARQVEGLGLRGDVLWGITTSGNSENILQALIEAKLRGLKTILFTGATGGRILKQAPESVDAAICIPSDDTARIQESHIMVGQILCAIVEKELFQLIS